MTIKVLADNKKTKEHLLKLLSEGTILSVEAERLWPRTDCKTVRLIIDYEPKPVISPKKKSK